MQIVAPERRIRRTEQLWTALYLLLNRIGQDHGVRVLCLSDEDGLPIVCTGTPEEADALAAYSPFMVRARNAQVRSRVAEALSALVPDASPSHLHVMGFHAGGENLFLASVGPTRMEESGMWRAIAGIRRIVA